MDRAIRFAESSRRRVILRSAAMAILAIVVGLIIGVASVRFGPVPALALILSAAAGLVFLRSAWVSVAAVIAVLCLVPYAVIPVSTPAGTPTFIEIVLFASLAVTLAVLLCDRRMTLPMSATLALWVGLVGTVVFAFLLGYGRGYTTQTMHDFGKFLLAVCSFVVIIVLVRRLRDGLLVVQLLMAGTVAAASVALALYAGGPGLTERVLVRLVPYGYPAGRIVRYIEDDPARAMRAVGTGVDPNSFGGLLMVGFVLAAGQFCARNPLISRWITGPAAILTASAMMLTYSRGAWVGAAAGVGLILLVRRRAWLPIFGGIGAIAVTLGLGSGFVNRLWLGFTLQDPATRLRLQEYQNALEIIRRHPWFGVGFGDAGSIELQEGVSSVYLTVAELAGLVGLVVFLVTVGAVLYLGLRGLLRLPAGPHADLVLTVTAAFAAMLTVGLVDHYLFNIQFPHMAALFWIVAGLIVALTRVPRERPAGQHRKDLARVNFT